MANKYLVEDKSVLLKEKLEKISSALQSSLKAGDFQTQEGYFLEAIRVLNNFYRTLEEPTMESPNVAQDQLPDVKIYQDMWDQLLSDLTVMFTEIENVEDLTVGNFNFATTEANRLTARLKTVSSKLGDYILYALHPTKDSLFFKDSFNDLSKIDVNSALLNTLECEINQDEGIVTLPVNREEISTVRITETPIIDPSSNGILGNNQELGAQYNGDVETILDNNPDTWFEYENVVVGTLDTKDSLILGLTINLGSKTVINRIRINPNNFGTKTTIQIDSIDTSIDGEIYTSVKDDIPIADFVTEDEANVFTLAPSTSKYAGQGIYTFTPRKVKYVRFTFRQTEPYIIETPNGDRLRYAIGLRDIDIRAFPYSADGEIVSIPYSVGGDEIRKVLIQSNQNPTELSELASIRYYISPDDGGTWYEIQAKELEGTSGVVSTPEILEFNGVSQDTIVTSRPVTSVRVKIRLNRNDEAFVEGSSSFQKRIETRTETHVVPTSSPFEFFLEEPPVDGSVSLIDPLYGSRGRPDFPYYIGHTYDNLNQRTYRLPFTKYPRPLKKVPDGNEWHVEPVPASEWMHIEVGGKEWDHATGPLGTYGVDDEVFIFSHDEGVLRFGDGVNGKAPGSNEPVAMWLDAERLYPSEAEDAHIAQLEFATSNSKADTAVKRYDKIVEVTEVLSRRATVIHLRHQNLTDITGIETEEPFSSGSKEDFLNGRDELSIPGDYSIDEVEGIIYTLDPTSASADITVSYKYQPIYELEDDEWDWASSALLRDSVSVKEVAWQTLSVDAEQVFFSSGATVLDVQWMALVRNTMTFDVTDGGVVVPQTDHPFVKEVPYMDGQTELGFRALQTIEQLGAHGGTGVEVFDLAENITVDTSYTVTFSDTDVFSPPDKGSLPVSPGDPDGTYWVDRANSKVYLKWSSAVPNPGTVTYYYVNPNSSDNGLYSVNYRLGRVYSQRGMDSAWVVKTSYEYTDFRAEYNIARILDRSHYDVDITNQLVRISDGEILKGIQAPRVSLRGFTPFYLVNYEYVAETREDIEELRDFFSPTVKDYALRVLTKGRIF